MGRISEERVLTLERQAADLQMRLAAVEAQIAPAAGAASAATAAEAPRRLPESAPSTARGRDHVDLEELLGGRVLAWTGGVAVIAGIAFLLAIAVSRGWIGPAGRTLVAGAISLGLVMAGAWLHEHRRRTDAALAALSAGIAGLFITVAVGGPVYEVLPAAGALTLAFATGALATCFAVRWRSRGIGALGIVGALLAPVLAGAPSTGLTLALLWLAAASGATILVWQRWNWLALAVFAITLGQWGWWLADAQPSAGPILIVLCLFGALNVTAAIGFELRVPASRLRLASALLLTANATTLALGGWYALAEAGSTTTGRLWIGALAAAHIAVGLATRATRVNRDLRMLALLLGTVLADVTAGLMLQGPILAGAFALSTIAFGVLARRVLAADDRAGEGHDALLLGLGLGGHLLLTTMQALTQVPPDALASDAAFTFGGYAAIAATAVAAFLAGRFVDEVRHDWRIVLDVVALIGAAYLTAAALGGALLAAAFAAEAVALGAIARRDRDPVAACGGGAYLALALAHALVFEATPASLVTGVDDLPGATLALGAAAAAALLGMRLLGRTYITHARVHAALGATGAITLLYLASVALVTAFAPGDDAQLLLSGLWAISGLVALVTGLRRDDRALRLGSLALLLVTVGKVFLYDLSALTSLYRVGSFIGLGLLLLVAAATWQRMRPRALPDLREVPPAAR
ncbi:MAG: DUF2339 domain-containing protein [Actinobacteria bacterium]|nr:DUF2339 domain-containing protein [Actinomycetota bacterium]